MQPYHKAVLVNEVITYLAPKPGGVYVDVTFGGGGHTRAILEAEPTCQVIAVDWDTEALERNAPPLEAEFPDRFRFVWGNFAQLPHVLKRIGVTKVDGILADFGTSQYQIFSQPGFSFKENTPLDMRMSAAHHRLTAADLLSRATVDELAFIFREYGEERYAHKIAQRIGEERKLNKIQTTFQLAQIVSSVVPHKKHHKIHPATRVFQALRIVVNKELENIRAFLINGLQLLSPEGRLVCISFHSLEDRLVKQFFREHTREYKLLTKRVVTATDDELAQNPSSRSARLRAGQRLAEEE